MNISCRSLLFVVAVIGFISGSVTAIEPAWLVGKPMNQWFQINGTSGAAGANVVAWSSLILREDTTELFIAASGGHHDSSDNRVVSIKLTDDQPQWILRAEPTPVDQRLEDVAYYLDGLPSSRHNYQYTHWVPNINRIVLAGARGVYGRAVSFPVVDGFNPDTNEWDPPGTWRNITPEAYGTVRERNSSIIWTIRLERLDLKEGTLTSPITTQPPNVKLRWPVAHDTKRHQLFSLQWADGQGYGDASNTQILVTFKNSTALQMFSEEKPTYSSMDYDPINDRFLFYYGQGTSAGRIYVVTPNDGNEWEMSILPLADGSAVPEPATISGINRRFLYVPGLNVFVCMPLSESNIWFIRVANFEEVPQSAPYVASPQSSNSPSITNSPSVKTNITSVATRLHWIANVLMLLCFTIIF